MKQLILIIVLLFSTLFSNVPFASAADLSHKQISEIYGQGYQNALLETVVEVNAKSATRLEENRDLLTQYYDDTKGYINQRIQDYGNVSNFGELLIEQASGAMTLADGVLEFVTRFFASDEDEPVDNSPKNCTTQITKITASPFYGSWTAGLNCGVHYNNSVSSTTLSLSSFGNEQTGFSYKLLLISNGIYYYSKEVGRLDFPTTFAQFQSYLTMMKPYVPSNYGLRLTIGGEYLFEEKEINPSPKFYTNHFNNMKSNPATIQPIYIPQLQPKLSCPDGDKVVQIDGRGGFVHANGVPVNAGECTVYWQKPSVTVDDDGKVLLTDPDTGETTDTGVKPPKDKIPVEDKGEGCDSVLCFLGGVTSGIADLISSILGLVGDILDALLGLFVPDDLNFVSEEFDKMSAKLTDKFSLMNGLKDTITGVFSSGQGGNPLSDINMALPAAPGFNFSLDTVSFIEPFVPRVKQIISGILFLMTIIYVYRKITGRGGVMEK